MGDGEGDRPTIETICPACRARLEAYARLASGVSVSIVDVVGREPRQVTVLLKRDGQLVGKATATEENDALIGAVEDMEART